MRTLAALLVASAVACGGSTKKPVTPEVTDVPAFTVEVLGEGRAIIFIPPLAFPGDVWDETIAHLGAGYQTHSLTLAGFGGAEPFDGPFLETVKHALIEYLAGQKLDRPVLVGHSIGGWLALAVAAEAPELVGGVVIVDMAPFFPAAGDPTLTPDAAKKNADDMQAMLAAQSDEEFRANLWTFFETMVNAPSELDPYRGAIDAADRATVTQAIIELQTSDLRDQVARITAPTLFILADEDMAPAIEAQAAAIPDYGVVVIPGTKHFLTLDDPESFQVVLDGFLEGSMPSREPKEPIGPTEPTEPTEPPPSTDPVPGAP